MTDPSDQVTVVRVGKLLRVVFAVQVVAVIALSLAVVYGMVTGTVDDGSTHMDQYYNMVVVTLAIIVFFLSFILIIFPTVGLMHRHSIVRRQP